MRHAKWRTGVVLHKYLLPLSIALLAAAVAFNAVTPAQAQSSAMTPVCETFKMTMTGPGSTDKVSEWVLKQRAAGYSQFFAPATASATSVIVCAW